MDIQLSQFWYSTSMNDASQNKLRGLLGYHGEANGSPSARPVARDTLRHVFFHRMHPIARQPLHLTVHFHDCHTDKSQNYDPADLTRLVGRDSVPWKS